ncbi:phage tail protein, partial [Bacillus pumilus]
IKEKLGGKITFNIDKKTNKTFSTYKDAGKESHVVETIDVIRGLEDKEHTVVATFKGKDSKNPNTKKMKTGFRVSVPKGNFIGLYRTFKDDEKYMFPPVTYIHPDEKLFLVDGRPRVAETVYEDSISKKEDMEKLLKEKVNPYPKLTIELDFEKVYDPKLEAIEDNICKGAIVPVIADTAYGILFEGEVRVQEIKYNPLNLDMKPSVTLTNYRKDIID